MIKKLINYLKFIVNPKIYMRVLVAKNTEKGNMLKWLVQIMLYSDRGEWVG